jgi:hypothetical protein
MLEFLEQIVFPAREATPVPDYQPQEVEVEGVEAGQDPQSRLKQAHSALMVWIHGSSFLLL